MLPCMSGVFITSLSRFFILLVIDVVLELDEALAALISSRLWSGITSLRCYAEKENAAGFIKRKKQNSVAWENKESIRVRQQRKAKT